MMRDGPSLHENTRAETLQRLGASAYPGNHANAARRADVAVGVRLPIVLAGWSELSSERAANRVVDEQQTTA
jgi:hypothetical protein